MADCDVCVVGAGLAGLAAALRLKEKGLSVRVLEARERVGGRVENVFLEDGTPLEIGGQWVGPTQDRVLSELKKRGIETFPTYNDGENVIYFKGSLKRYKGTIPKLPPLVLMDVGIALSRLNSMARAVSPSAPFSARQAGRLDSITVEGWMQRAMFTAAGREMMRIGVNAVLAAEPKDVSLLHFLFYIASAGDLNKLLDVAGGAQQDRVVGGSHKLAEAMAADLSEGELSLANPVLEIGWSGEAVRVKSRNTEVSARAAIVAVPPALVNRIFYDPPLPAKHDQLYQKLPMGSVIKVMAVYDEPFWRAEGLTGQATSDAGAVRITFDNSPQDGHVGVMLGFLEGDEARKFFGKSEKELREEVIACFTNYFGKKAASPQAFLFKNWSDEPFTRGCYGAHLAPGVWSEFGPALNEPVGPIFFAGTEHASIWSGYMDGALRSGDEVAEAVAKYLG